MDEGFFVWNCKKIADLQDNPEVPGVLGVSIPEEDNSWIYYIASASSKNDEKFQSTEIPSFTWAFFSGKGTNRDIQILEKRIVTEWLPTSGYEYDNGPDVEVYLSPDPKNAVFEVWIPVVKKSKIYSKNQICFMIMLYSHIKILKTVQ